MGCVFGAKLQRDKIKTNRYSQAQVLDLKHILTWFWFLVCYAATPLALELQQERIQLAPHL